MDEALAFLGGLILGCAIGVFLMCLLQINHGREEIDLGESEPKGR